MKKHKILNSLVLAICFSLLTGCSKETKNVIKELTIDNNISYDYVLSTSLTLADGFASDIAVISADERSTEDGIISATSALLVDITTGEVLYQKNPHLRLHPASTTKVLTGLVALENCELDKTMIMDDSILITEDNAWLCDFRVGDKLNLEQVLYGSMVNSGNDAAAAVAYIVSGTNDKFAELMNKKALEIGATNSNFCNPHGLTNESHYTTAYDLYLIFNEAVKNQDLLKMMSTVEYKTAFIRGKYTIEPKWTNGNQFINGMVSAPAGVRVIAGKTGYTEAAGNCLVILSEAQNGHQYISVILNANGKPALYNQMTYLLEQIH